MIKYLVLISVLNCLVLAQFDPGALASNCTGSVQASQWITTCGPYGGSGTGTESFFCASNQFVTAIVGSKLNGVLSHVQFQCSDGTQSPGLGTVGDTPWTGPLHQLISYVMVVIDSSNLLDLLYGSMNTPVFTDPVQFGHAKDPTYGCPLIGMSIGKKGGQATLRFRCRVCSPGFGVDPTGQICSACPVNHFKSVSAPLPCTPCSPYGECTSTSMQCIAGYELNARNGTCDSCVPGLTYKPVTAADPCYACPKGPGVKECTVTSFQCNEGYEKVTYGNGGACSACTLGVTYSENQVCVPCPLNSQCVTTGFQCIAGYQKSAISNTCERCPTGFYKTTVGNTACEPCPTGSLCYGDDWSCASGFYYNETESACRQCKPGTYKSSVGTTSCLDCPANATCTHTAFNCLPGYQNVPGKHLCEKCPVNRFKSTAGNVPCRLCPTGGICDSTAVLTCLAGFYWNAAQETCLPCPDQSFKLNSGRDVCISCNQPFVSFCNATALWCQAGYQVQGTACTACPTGSFKSLNDSSVCRVCPQNTVCTRTGYECSPGYNMDRNGTCQLNRVTRSPTQSRTQSTHYVTTVLSPGKPDDSSNPLSGSASSWLIPVFGSIIVTLVLSTLVWLKRREDQRKGTKKAENLSMKRLTSKSASGLSLNSYEVKAEESKTGSQLPAQMNMNLDIDYRLDRSVSRHTSYSMWTATLLNQSMIQKNGGALAMAKKIQKTGPLDTDSNKKFLHEVSLMLMVSRHTGFCRLVGYDEQRRSIITKFYNLGSLNDYLANKLNLWLKRDMVRIASEIARAIKYLHRAHIAHANITASHIFLELDASLKLKAVISKLGSVHILKSNLVFDRSRSSSKHKITLFSPPEQIQFLGRQNSEITEESDGEDPLSDMEWLSGDIFSFGCVLHRLIHRENVAFQQKPPVIKAAKPRIFDKKPVNQVNQVNQANSLSMPQSVVSSSTEDLISAKATPQVKPRIKKMTPSSSNNELF